MTSAQQNKQSVKPKLRKIVNAKDAALDLLRVYVERGDNMEAFRHGYLGAANDSYYASVGGYLDGKNYSSHYVVVKEVNKKVVNKVFKYQDIVDELQTKQLSLI